MTHGPFQGPPPQQSWRPRPRPELNLAGVCLPLPIWLLASFILAILVPAMIGEYRLAHGLDGVPGTVTVTAYREPTSGPWGVAGQCSGDFQPTDPKRERRHIQEVPLADCRVGAKLTARTCSEQRFPYPDDCEHRIWTKGDDSWKSPWMPVAVAGTVWPVCTVTMVFFFVRWRRVKRRLARSPVVAR